MINLKQYMIPVMESLSGNIKKFSSSQKKRNDLNAKRQQMKVSINQMPTNQIVQKVVTILKPSLDSSKRTNAYRIKVKDAEYGKSAIIVNAEGIAAYAEPANPNNTGIKWIDVPTAYQTGAYIDSSEIIELLIDPNAARNKIVSLTNQGATSKLYQKNPGLLSN